MSSCAGRGSLVTQSASGTPRARSTDASAVGDLLAIVSGIELGSHHSPAHSSTSRSDCTGEVILQIRSPTMTGETTTRIDSLTGEGEIAVHDVVDTW